MAKESIGNPLTLDGMGLLSPRHLQPARSIHPLQISMPAYRVQDCRTAPDAFDDNLEDLYAEGNAIGNVQSAAFWLTFG